MRPLPSLRLALLVLPLVVLAPLAAPLGTLTAPTFQNFVPTPGLGTMAGEPSLGVNWQTGIVLYQAGDQTLRVTFNDAAVPSTAAWALVRPISVNTPAGTAGTGTGGLDPILFTDSVTGATFAGGDGVVCGILSKTTDDGASWSRVVNPCAPPAIDHETIGGGAIHAGLTPPADPLSSRIYYYCLDEVVDECTTSWDGGLTWLPPTVVSTSCFGLMGHVKVGIDGTAYIPTNGCASGPAALRSVNNGLSWTHYDMAHGTTAAGFDPSVGAGQTTGSVVYGAWEGANHHQYVSKSSDQGQHWSAPVDLSAVGGLGATSFSAVVVGDDARAAVAFLASTTGGDGHAEGFHGTWDLYVATTLDAGASWTVTKASANPVQRGYICDGGIGCSTGRNLLDFIDATIDARGRLLVAYADGCTGACALPTGTEAQSTAALATIARQSGGTCMLAAVCG
jgi:hypothetical protein